MTGRLAFRLAIGMAVLIDCALLWSVDFLPCCDLPQHIAQVSIWKNFSDPAMGFSDHLCLNFSTPYLGGYMVARVLAEFMSVSAAMKIVLIIPSLLVPLIMYFILLEAGLDVWLTLLGFPIFWGFAFFFGFFNFLFSVPIGMVFILSVLRYARDATWKWGMVVAVASFAMVFVHALTWFVLNGIALICLWPHEWGMRSLVRRYWPLLPTVGLVLPWVLFIKLTVPQVNIPMVFWTTDTLIARVVGLGGFPLGLIGDRPAVGPGLFIVVLLWAWGLRPKSPTVACLPFTFLFLLSMLGPVCAFGTYYISDRFSIYLLPLFFLCVRQDAAKADPKILRICLAAVVFGWMAVLLMRFHSFDGEAKPFRKILDAIPSRPRLATLVFEPESKAVPFFPFLQFGAYIHSEKGGEFLGSFSGNFAVVGQYRADREKPRWEDLAWLPFAAFTGGTIEQFSPNWDIYGRYDCLVVKSSRDLGTTIFRASPVPYVLQMRSGDWWWYARQQ